MAGFLKSLSMVLLVAAVVLANVIQPGEAAVGCGKVVSYLNPCIPFVTNKGPLGGCCGGVKGLNGIAKTTADRQSVCNCLKSLAGSLTGLNYGKVAGLPGQCGVSLPYKISPSTDCSRVS